MKYFNVIFVMPSYSVYLLTLLFVSLIWEWKNTICLTSFDFFDVQSVKRFVRRLITKWYDHYSSHHLIYNVNWIASLECTVFHRSIDLPRAWRRALNIHWKEGKIYPSCKMAYVVILSASYFLFTSVNKSPYNNSFRVLQLL